LDRKPSAPILTSRLVAQQLLAGVANAMLRYTSAMDTGKENGVTFRWLPMAWAVGSDLSLAGIYLITWVSPTFLGDDMLTHLLLLMILEMLVILCTGMFGAIASRSSTILMRAVHFLLVFGLAALIAAGYCLAMGSFWALFGFFFLILTKAHMVIFRPPDFAGQQWIMINWAGMVVAYLGLIFVTHLVELPPLGLSPAYLETHGFEGGGTWEESPQIFLAFGAAYFTTIALWTLLAEGMGVFFRKRRLRKRSA